MSNIRNMAQAQEVIDSYTGLPPKDGNYKLDRMRSLMGYLGNPQDSYKSVHIAGTSGKTSTAYYAAALLVNSGYKVGLTVSPHIEKVSERAQINLKPLLDGDFCHELSIFNGIVTKSGIKPSRFEFLTAFAFWLFKRQNVDYAVIEVGLGGLLDATNVINRDNKICIITDIGIDHTKLLGNTISSIASQKAGIIHKSNSVYIHKQPYQVMRQVTLKCKEVGASLNVIKPNYPEGLEKTNLPDFQKRNLNLAFQSLSSLISPSSISKASRIHIPARMETVKTNSKTIIIDGSHNVQKIESLVKDFIKLYPSKHARLLVSFGNSEKLNIQVKFSLLARISNSIVLTTFDKYQDEIRLSIKPEKLAKYAKLAGFKEIVLENDCQKALGVLTDNLTSDDIGLVTGSFYLAARLRQLLNE